ncbi:Cd2+/Zn2+-exporting ATPase [Aquabacterium commune]|uniref:P-type Zn(2+) transporter n=2 Tax=Aquabacterium commune TaxID=70586 RepID=A0A4R6RE16_9BURK|nr:Cd2+/Zn2+-exporting ATPase [Aquabacterium commune]
MGAMSTPPRRHPVIPIRVASAPPEALSADHGHPHGEHGGHSEGSHDHSHDHGDCCTSTLTPPPAAADAPPGTRPVRFRIEQMDCPTEEGLIRQKLAPMAGVARLDFNLLSRELTVHHTLDATLPLEAALADIGMAPRVLAAGQTVQPLPPAVPTRQRWLLAASGLAAVGAEAAAWATGVEVSLPVMALAALSMGLAGGPTAQKGWIALRHATLNIYFLMSLAVLGALVIGKWSEAAMVLFLFAVAEAIEALSLERARKAVQALSALAPEVAWVWSAKANGSGDWAERPVAEVAVGSRIRVRAGERVPLDADITQGQGALNEAAITGEGLPVDKAVGDALFAGSVLADGLIEARTTATASGGTLARMAAAIQQAQAQRAPTQRFVDAFARWYTPAVVLLALGVALLGPWLSATPSEGWQPWAYQALVLLVIACPCALVVSTPVTVVSGLAAAARLGILVKGGVHLEAGRHLRAIALDKTGTLTEGRPALTDCQALPGVQVHGAALSDAEALRIAASLDAASTHPVARAVAAGWRERVATAGATLSPVHDFTLQAGRGVQGTVDGQAWCLGHARWLQEKTAEQAGGAHLGQLGQAVARLQALEAQGRTAFVLFNADGPAAVLGVADTLRPTSAQAIQELQALGVHTAVLSGDNAQAVRHVAAQLGVADARGGLLPQDKLSAIEALKAAHGRVAMVGDGVNDAPALARADIGLAMGAAGTATALETADVAIMDDDPRKLASFIRLSQATGAILWQNIALALGIKVVFFALAFTGQATLWMAVFADMGASLLVVFNGLRLLRWRP